MKCPMRHDQPRIIWQIKKVTYLSTYRMTKVLDFDLEVNEFKLQWRFHSNTLEKVIKLLIPPSLLFFYNGDFGIK